MLKRVVGIIEELFFSRSGASEATNVVAPSDQIEPDREEKPVDAPEVISRTIQRMHGKAAIGMRLVSDIGQQITVMRPVDHEGLIKLGVLSRAMPPRVYSHKEELYPISRVRTLMERGNWVLEKGTAHTELLRRAGVKRKAFVSSLDDVSIHARNWPEHTKGDDEAPTGPRR